jgi:hypothetical protein
MRGTAKGQENSFLAEAEELFFLWTKLSLSKMRPIHYFIPGTLSGSLHF